MPEQTPDHAGTDGKVIFWSLRQKFVDSDTDVPEEAQQVMYYSLAIGHHVGMIDCLNTENHLPAQRLSVLGECASRRGGAPQIAGAYHLR